MTDSPAPSRSGEATTLSAEDREWLELSIAEADRQVKISTVPSEAAWWTRQADRYRRILAALSAPPAPTLTEAWKSAAMAWRIARDGLPAGSREYNQCVANVEKFEHLASQPAPRQQEPTAGTPTEPSEAMVEAAAKVAEDFGISKTEPADAISLTSIVSHNLARLMLRAALSRAAPLEQGEGTQRTRWFIERPQQPPRPRPRWLKGQRTAMEEWTDDPHAAYGFSSKADAEKFIADWQHQPNARWEEYIEGLEKAFASEHIFVDRAAPPVQGEPTK